MTRWKLLAKPVVILADMGFFASLRMTGDDLEKI